MLMKKRIAVGMSGGTDSSVVAALLVEQGYEVIGLTAQMRGNETLHGFIEEITRIEKICAWLGIQHNVVNTQNSFEKWVVSPFIEEYIAGRTPSPCITCNQFIKFGLLLKHAIQLNCQILATGHYARIEKRNGAFHLLRAIDHKKDQSYFLHRLSQQQLAQIIFPLGEWTKTKVKKWSEKHHLPMIPHDESQDLCFVENGKYAELIENRVPQIKKKGLVYNDSGEVLGEHEGIHRFTVGQRVGLGIALGKRVYVSNINAEKNSITLAPRERLMHSSCLIKKTHWISGAFPVIGKTYTVQPRYGHCGAPAKLEKNSGNKNILRIRFKKPQFALTPGQAVVVYDGDETIGGGWINV